MLFQLWINLNVAQFFDIEDHLMGLEEKLFPHSILHPSAPLHQPWSVFKDVTTNSNGLQKRGESNSEALGSHFFNRHQKCTCRYRQREKKLRACRRRALGRRKISSQVYLSGGHKSQPRFEGAFTSPELEQLLGAAEATTP